MKKNQVSLRSGGIRGASFVVLYAALACAACLLAVPRSKSLFSSVQFRQQNVAKKNSEFSLLCLSLCEFEFQRILHILPDSDNHKWERKSSQCSLHPWDEHAMRILPELPMISMIPMHFPCSFNGAMCHVPEEHILKQRHVSHRQRELYWVAILVCKKMSYRCSANSFQFGWVFGSVWIPTVLRLRWGPKGSVWLLGPVDICNGVALLGSVAPAQLVHVPAEFVKSRHSKHFETAMAALQQFESQYSVHGTWWTWHFYHSIVLHYLTPIEYARFFQLTFNTVWLS